MPDLDHLLADLGSLPLDPRLSAIDGAVMAGLEREMRPAMSRGMLGAMTALAMMGGVAATVWPQPPARAATVLPLGVSADLVPSSLLGEGH